MAPRGLDSAVPPAAAKAKEMLDEIGGGNGGTSTSAGPEASFTWQPEHMHAYQQGIHHFLLAT